MRRKSYEENLKVSATGSNDSGVSWIVETEGKTIFHAGDLCNWYARFLVDGTPEGEIFSEEFGQYINPVAEEKRFLGELKDIQKITDSFDLVMFPVDGRIGNGYTLVVPCHLLCVCRDFVTPESHYFHTLGAIGNNYQLVLYEAKEIIIVGMRKGVSV